MAQYGAPNPVYEANNTPLVNRGQQNMNQMRGMQGGGFNQPQQPGMFEGWGPLKYLMGPASWGIEAFKPGTANSFLGGLKNFAFGSPASYEQIENYTPEQQQMMSQLLGRGWGGLDQFDFGPIEQQARTGFEQNTIPSIAERFTSMGGQGSSAFQNALGVAGAGLEQNLAAMKQQYNLQRQPLFHQMLQMGLHPRFDTFRNPAQPGFLQTGGSALLGGIGKGLGALAVL